MRKGKGKILGEVEINRDEVYTVEDIGKFPSGTASIYRVTDPTEKHVVRCRIDDNGFLRTFRGKYVPLDYNVEPWRHNAV